MKKHTLFSRLAVSCLCFLLLFPGILPTLPPIPPENPPVSEDGEPPIQPLSDDEPIEELD